MESRWSRPHGLGKERFVGVKKGSDGKLDYSEAAIFHGTDKNNRESHVEVEKRPEKLFRAFAIHPEELSLEKFKETLTPQNVNAEDETKSFDGNEQGVYMSTNESMVDDFYSNARGWANPHIKVLPHNTSMGFVDRIKLSNCGIILEIDTKGLEIRKPEITQYLQTEHNNGMEGDEWIADRIEPEHYKVKRLVLSRHAHDKERFEIEIKENTPEALQKAINTIKEEFQKRKKNAEEFKDFLTTLSEIGRRKTRNSIKKEFQKYKRNKI